MATESTSVEKSEIPCTPVKEVPVIEESDEAKLKTKYETLLTDYKLIKAKIAIALYLICITCLAFLVIFNRGTAPIAPKAQPPAKPITLEGLVLDRIYAVSPTMYPPHELDKLDIYLANVKYYQKIFGKYPDEFSPHYFLIRLFSSWFSTPAYIKQALDLYESNIHPIDQNPNIIDYFKTDFFLFDHNIENYRTEKDKHIYHQRVLCIEEIIARISGKGIEDQIIEQLLKYPPQDFIFKLIKKIFPRCKIDSSRDGQVCQKGEMVRSNGFPWIIIRKTRGKLSTDCFGSSYESLHWSYYQEVA
ncbi:MAG: hypothetical protein Harvfovirus1_93 [Harvfovirus sp.]|uniref:Uncharacterized protein n=1 Tax=Harvfovirus sp. TaxID=2487768 RepID=A0A3G4ZZX3_9VIRU|nr:MAG: hypothetical protein Harvfovirus1_93 [Harvfovirus sp.]